VLHDLPSRFPGTFTALFLALVTGTVFWRHLFKQDTFRWDFLATSRWPVYFTALARSGRFSEWVPFVGGGLPVAECALCGLYAPLWWLMGWAGIPATVNVLTDLLVFHILLGSLGMWALARRYVPTGWALLAATSYLFFGGFYGNATHDVILRGHAYAPWLLWSLTLPRPDERGRRILLLPLWAWLLATLAYPGQTVGFFLVGGVYLAVQLAREPSQLRHVAPILIPVLIGSAAIVVAAYLPYLAGVGRGELFRPFPPSAEERAIWALKIKDLFGLYLNPFAWQDVPGTITAWSVGSVALIGLAAIGRNEIRKSLPLIVTGLVALALAMLPSWVTAGRVLLLFRPLFPSRLPASDYKAIAASCLVCLAALGWNRIATERRASALPGVAAVLLLAGLVIVPGFREVLPTKLPTLAAAVIVGATAVAYQSHRLNSAILLAALVILTLADGGRIVSDMEILPDIDVWHAPREVFLDAELHDRQARMLAGQLDTPPERRPARETPLAPHNPVGDQYDPIGYLGMSYRLGDYGNTVTAARHRIMQDPRLQDLMLRRWTAWVIPCRQIDCRADELRLPEGLERRESTDVNTVSYGVNRIEYRVQIPEPSLLVENEIPAPGWSANRRGIRQVRVAGALRGWVLPAGSYRFSAVYVQPERPLQLTLAGLALVAWAGAGLLQSRRFG
jgi:hypothetical protein